MADVDLTSNDGFNTHTGFDVEDAQFESDGDLRDVISGLPLSASELFGEDAATFHPSHPTGAGPVLKFRMRGFDQTEARIVYWSAVEVDGDASEYTGPGPVVDIVVSKVIG